MERSLEMSQIIELSALAHTWFLDLDGTILKHNGYKIDSRDTLLDGALDFMAQIPDKDLIVFVTSREEMYREQTVSFLEENGIRYDVILFGAPPGERIVVNDEKPGGLKTAVAFNVVRDTGLLVKVKENHNI